MSTNQPTLVEQSVESTRKLAWYDDMIRHYGAIQWHAKALLEAMQQQVRMDEKAYGILTSTYNLATAKLDRLNEARKDHYWQHNKLMDRILDGEE